LAKNFHDRYRKPGDSERSVPFRGRKKKSVRRTAGGELLVGDVETLFPGSKLAAENQFMLARKES